MKEKLEENKQDKQRDFTSVDERRLKDAKLDDSLKMMRNISDVFGRPMTTGEGISAIAEVFADKYKIGREQAELRLKNKKAKDLNRIADKVLEAKGADSPKKTDELLEKLVKDEQIVSQDELGDELDETMKKGMNQGLAAGDMGQAFYEEAKKHYAKDAPEMANLNTAYEQYKEGNKEAVNEFMNEHLPEKRLVVELSQADKLLDEQRSQVIESAGQTYLANKGLADMESEQEFVGTLQQFEREDMKEEIVDALQDSVEMLVDARSALRKEDGLESAELKKVTRKLSVEQTIKVGQAIDVPNDDKAEWKTLKTVEDAAKQNFARDLTKIQQKNKGQKVSMAGLRV